MLTKEQAQSLKQIREIIDVELPIIKKRLEIVESGREQQCYNNLLADYRKNARFNIDNTDSLCLLVEIDVKLLEILETLKEINDAKTDLRTEKQARRAHGAG